jgi:hypothetical protein
VVVLKKPDGIPERVSSPVMDPRKYLNWEAVEEGDYAR